MQERLNRVRSQVSQYEAYHQEQLNRVRSQVSQSGNKSALGGGRVVNFTSPNQKVVAGPTRADIDPQAKPNPEGDPFKFVSPIHPAHG